MFLPTNANCYDSIVNSGLSYTGLELAYYNTNHWPESNFTLSVVLERKILELRLSYHQSQQWKEGAFLQECPRQPPQQQKDMLQKVMFRSHFTSPQVYRMRMSACSWVVPKPPWLPLTPFFPCAVQAQRNRSSSCRTSTVLNHDPHLLLSQLQPEVIFHH